MAAPGALTALYSVSMTPSILPFVHAQGSWGDIGRQVGQMLAPAIERHLEAWTQHVVDETRCTREAVEAAAAPFAAPIREHTPFLWEELDGMAQGSGIPIARLLILQARAEVMRVTHKTACRPRSSARRSRSPGGAAGGKTLFGQNVDLVPFVQAFGVVIRQYPKDGPAALLYTTAGLLGHNGLNEAGVGVCANFIEDPTGWGDGLPRYLLSRLALREESADAARTAALRPPRAASRNLLIADDRGTLLDVEALRGEAGLLCATDGLLVHANHLECPQFQGYETPSENSLARRARLPHLLEGAPGPSRGRHPGVLPRPHQRAAQPVRAPVPGPQPPDGRVGDRRSHQPGVARHEGRARAAAPYATYTLATCRTGAFSVTVRDRYQPAFGD